jgi:hypothetical protein
MRPKITIKQLKRRVGKLEDEAAVSASADEESDDEIRMLFDFLTRSEQVELLRLTQELLDERKRRYEATIKGDVKCTDEMRRNESKISLSITSIELRSAARRELRSFGGLSRTTISTNNTFVLARIRGPSMQKLTRSKITSRESGSGREALR